MKEWYGVKTFPGYEYKVQEKLNKLMQKDKLNNISDVFIPTYKNYTFVRRVIKLKEELVYPGYVFIKMNLTNEVMYSVRGVQYILGYAGTNELKKKPDIITEAEIAKMEKGSQEITTSLKKGDTIIVIDGMNEYETDIISIDPYTASLEVKIDSKLKEFSFDNINKIK